MKIIPLALLFPALLATSAAEAVTVYNSKGTQLDIYGRIEAQTGNEWTAEHTNATNLTGRLGFEAKQQLDEQFGPGSGRAHAVLCGHDPIDAHNFGQNLAQDSFTIKFMLTVCL